ncbi:putative efflux protein [Selenomonas ruminantium subsp. lactilytica TAM6421]|uniref:Putative efflux protein n=1 Tax=Selenomonas ruminantium subsp. lactilytica (strain NBRC 103574 / TAM6421) TaxID=927704 RepID=I0GMF5_SELRL|nr:efflux RND transporter permease subunit [Selenomonas ruminantium]BAL81942.1 putative efflux protein [Selenomonas ruminantium subsp. lactilytica TAM6421]
MRNLTEVSLKNRTLVWYFIVITAIGGILSYFQLGRMEDPQFTIRQMVVSAAWPGATAEEMQEQVTDKLEKRLQDTPHLKAIKSENRAGQTVIYVELQDEMHKADIRPTWRDVRNFCEDIKKDLPEGVYGPYYNDRFDDVFGTVYAVTGDGYSYEELRQYAEKTRRMLLNVPSVQKVELIGEQKEKIYVELDTMKLSELGISPQVISNALKTQNEMTAAAMVDTDSSNVYLRLSGQFADVKAIEETPISVSGRNFRLGDVAKVSRKAGSPADSKMFFNGEPAVGIAVSMEDGGNILDLGENLKKQVKAIQGELPAGLEIRQVANQSEVVRSSINEFIKTLMEAIVIVLAVSFMSLGWRTGMVVACCIPLVLCGVFVCMYVLGIDLHKVSLGALIIALGLLVDDAIIAVEMMSVKLEAGLSRFDAACFAFKATAKPMLTGTLITCAGFIPVAFSKGMASEFCSALFPVIGIALVLSWIVSVMVAPLLGTYMIRVKPKVDEQGELNPYQSRFYVEFRKVLRLFLTHRRTVLLGTVALFVLSLVMMPHIRQEFFPTSTRPEVLMELKLPEGASMEASQEVADRMSNFLQQHEDLLDNYSYYVGRYAPRFVLTVDPKTSTDNVTNFVIVAKDVKSREKLAEELKKSFNEDFADVRAKLQYLQTGPPADYPVMLRVTGYNTEKTKEIAHKVEEIVAADSNNYNVHLDWNEKSKVVKLELDQDKLKSLGLSAQAVKQMIYTEVTGAKAAQFYTGDRTLDITLRLAVADREDLGKLKNLPIYLGSAGYVPLEQIAKISYGAEDGLIKRRNLLPTITVQAEVHEGTANDATKKAYEATKELRENLPFGCKIEVAGSLESSNNASGFLLVPIPAMIFVIMTLLMFQLDSAKQMLLTLLTAPLGLIGVVWGMLLTGSAMGFVAELGILALFGMIIRNSVILIDQIKKHIAEGESPYDAVVDSSILRFRPIMLTAAAAILGMIPLMASTFWGPMAVAISSGLLVATILTLLVLPTMYAVAYKVENKQ